MAVTSGFFDAHLVNGIPDRKYSADDFGAIFDGIISDGIFQKYPSSVYNETTGEWEPFKVTAESDSLAIQVNPGRAWFDRTWTLNDDVDILTLVDRNTTLDRIDGVFIRTDKDNRQNTILVYTGEPSISPQKPNPTNTANVKYYPLAYIRVAASEDITKPITNDDITNAIGVYGGTQYAKSNITDVTTTTESIIKNLEAQFDSYQKAYGKEFEDWFESIRNSIGGLTPDQIIEVSELVADTYSSDYLAGAYPFVEGTGLYLSSSKKVPKPVIINFGFVSASMAANPNANELIVITEELQE